MKNILKGVVIWALLAFAYIITNGFVSSLVVANLSPEIPIQFYYVLTAIGFALSIGLFYLYRRLLKNFSWNVMEFSKEWSSVIGPIILYVASLIFQQLLPSSVESDNQQLVEKFVTGYPAVAFFLVVVTGPILEEYLFRGLFARYLFPQLDTNVKVGMYLLLSSTLFSFFHGPTEFLQFMVYFSMGITLGWLYFAKKDLHYPMALHVFNNAIGFFLMVLV